MAWLQNEASFKDFNFNEVLSVGKMQSQRIDWCGFAEVFLFVECKSVPKLEEWNARNHAEMLYMPEEWHKRRSKLITSSVTGEPGIRLTERIVFLSVPFNLILTTPSADHQVPLRIHLPRF